MALDGISFLPADMSSSAFGRERPSQSQALALDAKEVAELQDVVEQTIEHCREDFESGFVAESPDKLRRIAQYYAAIAGTGAFPAVSCNAPYMSVVVEADGAVRPCFFHEPVGNIRLAPLGAIVANNLPASREHARCGHTNAVPRAACAREDRWEARHGK